MDVRIVSMAAAFAVVVGGATTALASTASSSGTVSQADCPTTIPNGKPPGRVGDPQTWARHGAKRVLSAILRRDGTLVTNAEGGYKMPWYARSGLRGRLVVRYWTLDDPSHVLSGRGGYFEGYYGASNETMAQFLTFTPGCWRVTGRVRKVRLSFVVWVVLGDR